MLDLSELKRTLGEYPILKAVAGHGLGDFKVLVVSLLAFVAFGVIFALFTRVRHADAPKAGLVQRIFPPEHFKSQHTRVDFFVFVLNKILWVPAIVAVTSFLVVQATASTLLEALFGEPARQHAHSWLTFAPQFLVAYLGAEFAFYWVHRVLHTNKVLWGFHRGHHSGEVLTFLTGERNHPLEMLLQITVASLFGGSAMALLLYGMGMAMHPALPMALFITAILVEFMDKLHHSHFRLSFGPLNYAFISSAMHQIHHSAETRHRDKNFGGTSSLFDWMFGTLYIPEQSDEFRLGLNDTEIGEANPHKNVRDFYVEPLIYASQMLSKQRARPASLTTETP